ncbi:MAG: magnesium transporter [Acholeplasmatales bacterium]|jgi:magnesium transporter|nr:magnesium transporter [Acholeplasmatales bacterium]
MKKKELKLSDILNINKIALLEAYDISKIILEFPLEKQIKIFYLITPSKACAVLSNLEASSASIILEALSPQAKKQIFNAYETDDLANILEELGDNSKVEEFLGYLAKDKREKIRNLLKYKEDTAKAMMGYEYVSTTNNLTSSEAIKIIIDKLKENDYLDTVFVRSHLDNKLVGIVSIKDLISAPIGSFVFDIMKTEFNYVYENDSIDNVISKVRDYDLNVIPVIDNSNVLLGIITADDIISEIKENYDETYHTFAGVNDISTENNVFKRMFSRLPWLLVSVSLNIVLAIVIAQFENTIEAVLALAFFQPTILGMSGNLGTQTMVVTILGLSFDELKEKKEIRKHIRKEILICLINAVILGLLAFFIVFAFVGIRQIPGPDAPLVGLTVSLALLVSLFVSGVISVLVPIIFSKLKIDPASASGPIISTIIDLVAILLYFGFATIILI